MVTGVPGLGCGGGVGAVGGGLGRAGLWVRRAGLGRAGVVAGTCLGACGDWCGVSGLQGAVRTVPV